MSNQAEYVWLPWERVTLAELHARNRSGVNVLDVLLGLADAGIDTFRRLDWSVTAVIVRTSGWPVLMRGESGESGEAVARWPADDGCVGLLLRVDDGQGRLATYLRPQDFDDMAQCMWVPAWTMSDLARAREVPT